MANIGKSPAFHRPASPRRVLVPCQQRGSAMFQGLFRCRRVVLAISTVGTAAVRRIGRFHIEGPSSPHEGGVPAVPDGEADWKRSVVRTWGVMARFALWLRRARPARLYLACGICGQ